MHLLTVVGARPQFVKAAPVTRAIAQRGAISETLVHTGQHYDYEMSRIFFQELSIPQPAHDLEIGSGPHGDQTGRMLAALERTMQAESPDAVMVYGDTNSTLAGALAAVKLHLPVIHVEAGLRSFDRKMPEEVNRVVTDHLSELLLAPTDTAVANLAQEGLNRGVVRTGDVMKDALGMARALVEKRRREGTPGPLAELGVGPREYVLLTLHRPANTDDKLHLAAILDGLAACGETVLFPIHPRTRKALDRLGLSLPANVRTLPPQGYLDFTELLASARRVATDSGGIQKEAYLLGVPCVTLRDTTEWAETVEAGWNLLVAADARRIAEALGGFSPRGARPELFGDGRAAHHIVAAIEERLGAGPGTPAG